MHFEKEYDKLTNTINIKIDKVNVYEEIDITIFNSGLAQNNINERVFEFLNEAQIEFWIKEKIYYLIDKHKDPMKIISNLQTLELDSELFGVVCEIILAN